MLAPFIAEGTTIPVTTNADSGAGSFRAALTAAAADDTIEFNNGIGTITLLSPLPLISVNLTIFPASGTQVLDGGSSFRGLLITVGTVSINNMTFQNCQDTGGTGGDAIAPGGGGMGAGGALYIGGSASVTINDGVTFSNCEAAGGDGGTVEASSSATAGGGGGGGLGGAGGSSDNTQAVGGGGGGGGYLSNGGANTISSGGSGGDGVGGIGGNGGSPGIAGSPGSTYGGGGGGGGGSTTAGAGGLGGFAGGGGGAGQGSAVAGGGGGFGGGGGSGSASGTGGSGGFLGGNGTSSGAGGGGAMGGTVFVEKTATFNVTTHGTLISSAGAVTGGSASGGGTAGQSAGSDFFLMSGSSTTFNVVDDGETLTISSDIDSDQGSAGGTGGGITKAGNGILVLTGTNTYTGTTTISGGTLQGTTSSVQGGVDSSGILIIDQSTNGTLSNNITGSGSLTINGSATILLSGTNDYSGGTMLNAGAVKIQAAGKMGSGSVSIVGGILETSGTFTDSNDFFLSPVSPTIQTIQVDSGIYTISGSIGGSGGLIKTGAGALALNGHSNYGSVSNGTTISAGTIIVQFFDAISAFGLTIDGGTLEAAATFSDGRSPYTLGSSNGTIQVDGSSIYTLGSSIGGAGALFKTGTGTLQLFGSNAYAGGTTVSAGTVEINNSGQLSTAGVTLNGGTLLVSQNASDANDFTLGASNGSISVASSIIYELSGDIGGTGSLSKTGAGTLSLLGTNNYSGGTIISAGTIAVAAAGQMGSGSVTLNGGTIQTSGTFTDTNVFSIGSSNGTIQVDSGAYTLSSAVGGAGSLTANGSGTLILTAANTYSGATAVTAGILAFGGTGSLSTSSVTVSGSGTIQVTAAGTMGAGTVTLNGGTLETTGTFTDTNALSLGASNGIIQVDSGTYTLSTSVGGTGQLTKSGSGTLMLATVNAYSGGTIISDGILGMGGSSTLGAGSITIDGGTLETLATFTSANVFTIGSFNGTIQVDSGTYTISSAMGGTGILTKSGSGTLLLTAASSYSGGTIVSAGTVAFGGSGALGSGPISINGGTVQLTAANQLGSAFVTIAGGLLESTGTFTYTNQFSLSPSSQTIQVDSGNLTISGSVGGNGALVKTGSGTLSLTGHNNYRIGTTINAGIIVAPFVDSISAFNLTIDGGTFEVTGTYSDSRPLVTIGSSGGTIQVDGSNVYSLRADTTGSGMLSKTGSGTLILTGGNNYSGGTSITGGTVALDNPNRMGTGNVTLDGATIELFGFTTIDTYILTLGSNNGTIQVDSGLTYTLSGNIIGTGSLTKTGPGILNLTGASNSYSGGTTISAGTLTVASSGEMGTGGVTFSGGTLQATGTFTDTNAVTLGASNGTIQVPSGVYTLSGNMGGSGSFSKTGAGTLSLTGTNNYSGGTTLSAGTLIIGSSGKMGTGTVTLNGGLLEVTSTFTDTNAFSLGVSNASIQIDGSNVYTLSGSLGGSGSLLVAGPGTLSLTGSPSSYSGGTTVNAGLILGAGGKLGSGSVLLNGGLLRTTATFTDTNAFTLAAGSQTIQTDSGTYTLSGNIGGTGALFKTGPGTLTLTGTNNYSGGVTVSAGTLKGTSLGLQGDIVNNSHLVFDQSFAGTYADVISGSGDVVKSGSGTLILSGVSSYTGKTYVDGGTLEVDGDISSSPDPIVAVGATLSGIGTVGTTIVDGTITGGNPFGTLTVLGDLALNSGSTFLTTVSATETSLVTVSNAVTISDATFQLTITPGSYSLKDPRVVLIGSGGITGKFTTVEITNSFASALTIDLTYTATEVLIGQTSVSLIPFAIGVNATNVAETLQTALSELSEIVGSVVPLATTNKKETYALNQLHPAQLKGMTISQENSALRVREAINQRIVGELDVGGCLKKDKKRVTVWSSALGDTLVQDNVANYFGQLTGYRTNTGGAVAGIDSLFADHFYAGALGAYTNSHLHFQDGKGTGDISTGYAGVYLSATGKVLYANASVIGSFSDYTVERHIRYGYGAGKINLLAKSDHGGNQILSHFDTGVNLNYFGFTSRIFGSFDYMSQTERGYSEHNAGQWELTVGRKNAIMMRYEQGLQFARCFCFGSAKLTVTPKISWVREVRVKGQTFNVNFTQGGSPFVIYGYFPDRSLVAPGLALTGMTLQDALLFDLYYSGEFKGNYSSNSFGGRIGYSF